MDEIRLIKPTIEYADDIMRYRQEFLDLNVDILDTRFGLTKEKRAYKRNASPKFEKL